MRPEYDPNVTRMCSDSILRLFAAFPLNDDAKILQKYAFSKK